MLNTQLLHKPKQRGDKLIARCPACAEQSRDHSGEHLVVFADGRFACSAHPGDAEHRRRIFALAGLNEPARPSAIHRPPPPAPPPPELPPDFAQLASQARQRLAGSMEALERVAKELGISNTTVDACTEPAGGALGWFPSIAIKGRPCQPGRIGYIYPAGIKLRKPWGDLGARFAWACGRATEPWRYSFAAGNPRITRFIITEGESDALSLIEAGFSALCGGDTAVVASPGTGFLPAWAPLFKDRHVVLCFDCDDPGREAAHKVAAMLRPAARSVQILAGWKGTHHE